jgi:hypothetical protein
MHLFWFISALVLTGTIFTLAQPLLAMPTVFLMAALWRQRTAVAPKGFFYFAGIINYGWDLYILLSWCAFCALLTDWVVFATVDPFAWEAPVVEHRWLYYAVGFFGCLAPVPFSCNR